MYQPFSDKVLLQFYGAAMKADQPRAAADPIMIVSAICIAAFIVLLCAIAAKSPDAKNILSAIMVGLGASGLILFRQVRKTTSQVTASEARALYAATHDSLTQLPNKTLFLNRLANAWRCGGDGEGERIAIFCVGLDRFDEIQGVAGDTAGDKVVLEISQRLLSVCPNQDTVARIGDDMFAMFWSGATVDRAQALAGQMVKLLSSPLSALSGDAICTCSIGIDLMCETGARPSESLRRASLALTSARRRPAARYAVFNSEMDADLKNAKALEVDLRRALADGALNLVYQPQVNAKGAMFGVEALVRWTDAQRGPVPPSVFVPMAEACGMSHMLGAYVLRQAFIDSKRWPNLKVAVNITPAEIQSGNLIKTLKTLLAELDVNPRNFELEITEGVLLSSDAMTSETLNGLRKLGFTLAIDDFGTGYSSLSYLRNFPIDKIKIDRSFIAHLGVRPESDAIVKAIVDLADALALKVIAEGVETRNQVDRLAVAGCSNIQGFFFSKPVDADHIDELVNKRVNLAA
jgi:diguanylate cyclase (GGDEF)-like protein